MNLSFLTILHGVFCILGIAVTILPIVRVSSRWIRFFDFPRLQIAVLLIALLASLPFAWQGIPFAIWGILLFAALAYQVKWIFPYTPLSVKEVIQSEELNPDRTFKLLMFNVRMENKNYDGFISSIHKSNPDIILANEVDDGWVQKIDQISSEYPYQVLQPQPNTYGMALYSRLELANVEVKFQVETDIPSIHCVIILKDGSSFNFHGIHPKPPDIHNDTEARDAELVLTGMMIKKEKLPSVIAGDLNDVAWSHTTRLFKRLSGMLDPRTGRGFYNTYSVYFPLFRYPLDHLFITSHFRLAGLKRLPACGSDHFPMLAELEYIPEKKHEQQPEKADAEDHAQASEILQDAQAMPDTVL